MYDTLEIAARIARARKHSDPTVLDMAETAWTLLIERNDARAQVRALTRKPSWWWRRLGRRREGSK